MPRGSLARQARNSLERKWQPLWMTESAGDRLPDVTPGSAQHPAQGRGAASQRTWQASQLGSCPKGAHIPAMQRCFHGNGLEARS